MQFKTGETIEIDISFLKKNTITSVHHAFYDIEIGMNCVVFIFVTTLFVSTVAASCDVNNGGCDRECIDSRDGPKCQCPSGFHLHQDGRTCLGIFPFCRLLQNFN